MTNEASVTLAEFTDDYRLRVCKIGQGALCCRYLTAGAGGFECAKRTSLRFTIDGRIGSMNAKGDNCGGAFNPQPAFILLQEHWGHPAGTIVYRCKGYDYGIANDDTRLTGKPHSSMTLEPSGDYPSFTIPDTDFEPVSTANAKGDE
jgi:hypothetical protein